MHQIVSHHTTPPLQRVRLILVALIATLLVVMALGVGSARASGPHISVYGSASGGGWVTFVNDGDAPAVLDNWPQIVSGDLFLNGRDATECDMWVPIPSDGELSGCRMHFGGGEGDVEFSLVGYPSQLVHVDTN